MSWLGQKMTLSWCPGVIPIECVTLRQHTLYSTKFKDLRMQTMQNHKAVQKISISFQTDMNWMRSGWFMQNSPKKQQHSALCSAYSCNTSILSLDVNNVYNWLITVWITRVYKHQGFSWYATSDHFNWVNDMFKEAHSSWKLFRSD